MQKEKTNQPTVIALRYKIERYRKMGDGTRCQALLSELNKLQTDNTKN